jgi:hypothetical protein
LDPQGKYRGEGSFSTLALAFLPRAEPTVFDIDYPTIGGVASSKPCGVRNALDRKENAPKSP